jgi:small subunit ribosomal protein S17
MVKITMNRIVKKINKGNTFIGYVIREQEKTVVVEITNITRHYRYKKIIKKISRYIVHDADNKCCVGDLVLFRQSKPFSSKKKWKIEKILKKNYGM